MAGETLARRKQRLRDLRAPFGLAAGSAVAGAALALTGAERLVPVRCPFLALTGLDCPFCGGTRGAEALLQGHLLTALGLNVLTTVLLLALVGGWVVVVVARTQGRTASWAPGPRAWRVFGFSVLAFWVLRNLPGPTAGLAA